MNKIKKILAGGHNTLQALDKQALHHLYSIYP